MKIPLMAAMGPVAADICKDIGLFVKSGICKDAVDSSLCVAKLLILVSRGSCY